MARKMGKQTKDRVAKCFLDYVKSHEECTARAFTSSEEAKSYNLTTLQFANIYREYKQVEPYKSLVDCSGVNRMKATVYRYVGGS